MHEEAEELVQEVFLSLWNRRSQVIIRHLDLYLTLAIKNQVYDYIKSQISYRKYQEYLIFQEINQQNSTDEIVATRSVAASLTSGITVADRSDEAR